MTEKHFQSQVVKFAKMTGWLVYHPYDSRKSTPGYPDLTLVKDRVMFRELKSEIGRLTLYQTAWAKRLLAAGADYAIWRPSQLQAIFTELMTEKE